MAARNIRVPQQAGGEAFDPAEKIQQSNTLKRHPKMDLNKTDLLRLLSYLEGELQARDVVIATLKAEKAKQLLYQAKYGRFGLGDPFVALQRDSDNMKDNSFDETAIKCMYDNQLAQLENLIATQRKAQLKMREQLAQVEKRYHKVLSELEDEKTKHAQDTAQGDDVTYMLEKERERLKQEVEFEKTQNRRMEKDLKKTLASLEEERSNSAKHKQVALMLIRERRKLVERILQEKHKCTEMEHILNDEKDKMINMAEGLIQESRKSLKMEAAMEKQLSEFDTEREQLRSRVVREESKNKELQTEADTLRQQVDELHRKLVISGVDDLSDDTSASSCFSLSKEPPAVSMVPSAISVSKTVHIPPSSIVVDNPRSNLPSSAGDNKKTALQINSSSLSDKRPISPGEMFSPASDIRIISDGSTGNRISVSAGSTTVVSTSGGKISFQIGQGAGPTRKSSSVGRGTPPPVPPNKPVLVSGMAAGGKPAVPPKVGITVSKDRYTSSETDSSSSSSFSVTGSSCSALKSVQIPVSVVTSQSNVPSNRSSKEASPIQNATQSVQLPLSPLTQPPPPPLSSLPTTPTPPSPSSSPLSSPNQPFDFSPSGCVPDPPFPTSPTPSTTSTPPNGTLDFLDPEMAQLHQVLVSMATDKGNTDCLNVDFASNVTTTSTSVTTTSTLPTYNNNTTTTRTTTTGSPAATMPSILKPSLKPLVCSLFSSSSSTRIATAPARTAGHSPPSDSSPFFVSSNQSHFVRHAASGNLQDLRKLLEYHHQHRQHENKDYEILQASMATAMVYAAQSGQPECLKLLLKYVSIDYATELGFYPLHAAAKNGHKSCLEILVSSGAKVNLADPSGTLALEWAAANGFGKCCAFLLINGSDLNLVNKTNTSNIFHRTVENGNLECLEILLQNKESSEKEISNRERITSIMDLQNENGETVCHLAAKNQSEDCLELILRMSDPNLLLTDKKEQTVYDVATPACHYLLTNKTKVPNCQCSVILQVKQFLDISEPPLDVGDNKTLSERIPTRTSSFHVGSFDVQAITPWLDFRDSIHNTISEYYCLLDRGLKTNMTKTHDPETDADQSHFTLGLSLDNIKSYTVGSFELFVDEEFPSKSPFDILNDNCEERTTSVTVTIEDTDVSSMSMAFSLLISYPGVQSYLRLLEQYKNVVFYGPRYSQKRKLAQKIAMFIAAKEAQEGRYASIINVQLHSNYSKYDITKLLIENGCMVPIKTENTNRLARILILDGLEKINIPEVLHDLMDAIEHRGQRYTFKVTTDDDTKLTCFLVDQFYVIGTMNKLRLSGLKVSVQQRFRWVQFRINTEPISGLLSRHLLRKILQRNNGKLPPLNDPVYLAVEWVVCVWQKLNDSLLKLGLPDAVSGPSVFMSCPVHSGKPENIYHWLKVVWNEDISPAVYEATLANHSLMKENVPDSNCEKVAQKALYVLLSRSVLSGCPLSGQEKSSYMMEFHGYQNSEGHIKSFFTEKSQLPCPSRPPYQQDRPLFRTLHVEPVYPNNVTTKASSTSPLSPYSTNVDFQTKTWNGNTNERNDFADYQNTNIFSSKRSLPDSLMLKQFCCPEKDRMEVNESRPKMRRLEIKSPDSFLNAWNIGANSSSPRATGLTSPSASRSPKFLKTQSGVKGSPETNNHTPTSPKFLKTQSGVKGSLEITNHTPTSPKFLKTQSGVKGSLEITNHTPTSPKFLKTQSGVKGSLEINNHTPTSPKSLKTQSGVKGSLDITNHTPTSPKFLKTQSGVKGSPDTNNWNPTADSSRPFSDETVSSPRDKTKRTPPMSFTFSLASPPPTLSSFKFLESGSPKKIAVSCEQRERQQKEPAVADLQLLSAPGGLVTSTLVETVQPTNSVKPSTKP